MKSVAIGRGVSLTTVGLGGSQLGNVGRVSTDEQCAAAVDAAWRGGVRYFDTTSLLALERRLGPSTPTRGRSTPSPPRWEMLVPTPERAGTG